MNVELCLKKNCDSVYLKEKTNKSIYNKRKILKKNFVWQLSVVCY